MIMIFQTIWSDLNTTCILQIKYKRCTHRVFHNKLVIRILHNVAFVKETWKELKVVCKRGCFDMKITILQLAADAQSGKHRSKKPSWTPYN